MPRDCNAFNAICTFLLQISHCNYCPGGRIEVLQKYFYYCHFIKQNVLGSRRHTVIFVAVPAEMKVIKSHASGSKLIAAGARKHFFIFARFFLCITQSLVCSVACFCWSFPKSTSVTAGPDLRVLLVLFSFCYSKSNTFITECHILDFFPLA